MTHKFSRYFSRFAIVASALFAFNIVNAIENIDHPANRPCIEKVKAFLNNSSVERISDEELKQCYLNFSKSKNFDGRSFAEYSCLIGVNASIEQMKENLGISKPTTKTEPQNNNESSSSSSSIIEISAFELMRQYENNELKADSMYKDKMITVVGEVSNIRRDIGYGHVIVEIKADNVGIFNIAANIKRSYEKKAMSLKKGERVKVKGIVIGVAEFGAGIDIDEASLARR